MAVHLQTETVSRATYLSPQSQNEIIDVTGNHYIKKKLVKEILESRYYAILADEDTSHNEEKLAIVIRFVNVNKDIREEFLEFKDLERTMGAAVSAVLLASLEALNIPIKDCYGQGYGSAASMSSKSVGVQVNILAHAPKVVYVHCASHCLNIIISNALLLQSLRNMVDKVKQVCIFFHSPKRNGMISNNFIFHFIGTLSAIIPQHPENGKKKPLITLCVNRWVAQIEAYDHFYAFFTYTVEIMAHIMHYDECPEQFHGCWQAKTRMDASALLKAITDFDFIVTYTIAHSLLSHMTGLTIKLQKKTNDIYKAFAMVSEVKTTYRNIRTNFRAHFDAIYDLDVEMAENVGIVPTAPRTTGRQLHRANAPVLTPKSTIVLTSQSLSLITLFSNWMASFQA